MCTLTAKRWVAPRASTAGWGTADFPPAPTQAGFTITELMVIVGIIALATALAVPNYSRWNTTSQLKQAATELQGELNLARLAAMNRNRSVTVTAAIVNGRVTATFIDGSGAQVMPPHTMLPLVNGVTGGPITFGSLGIRVGGGAGNQLITLTNTQALTYSIAVTPAGKSTWCPRATCP